MRYTRDVVAQQGGCAMLLSDLVTLALELPTRMDQTIIRFLTHLAEQEASPGSRDTSADQQAPPAVDR